MLSKLLAFVDWFVPEWAKRERSDHNLARVFVFTHIGGPAMAQVICVFLYRSAPDPDFAVWTMIVSTWSFWLLPFVLKVTRSLHLVGFLSMELLAFAALFGAFHFGGMSSPFLPWLVISVFLGFFYLSDHPFLVLGSFATQFLVFAGAYAGYGFPERISLGDLSTVGWVSILSATIYMSWIAIYYNIILSMRSELEKEADRHRATSLLLQEAKALADSANHAKSIFFAKMSHELRTPLNAVIGFSEMLLEEDAGRGDPAKGSDLQKINRAGKHLLSLVTEVLDFSKIESDTWDIAISAFDLRTFAEEALATIRPLADGRRNQLVLNCPKGIGAVRTDSTKLRQSVLNLLSNAAKFTEHGTITMTVLRDSRETADWVEIRVEDTGVGIAPDDLPKLFQNYRQVAAGASKSCGGTGLGLAVSQKLCGLLGGRISCESELGKGARFTIRIPATLTQKVQEEQAADKPSMPALAPG